MSGRDARPPLLGIVVLDLTHALAGPYCTMILGDLGADVVKVEPPGRGDEAREWGPPFVGGESAYFLSVNRNKRSVVINLKSERGQDALRKLCRVADVVVENFAPGTAARLGVDHMSLQAVNPRLVYASISGFGQSSSVRGGYDLIAQGTSGLMSLTGEPDGPPIKVGISIGDLAAGMFAAHAILAGLIRRLSTGQGCCIDISLNDALLALHTYQAGRLFVGDTVPSREGNHHPTIAPYGTFATRDGAINIAVGSDAQFVRLCDVLGGDGVAIAQDVRFGRNEGRVAHRRHLIPALERLLAARPCAEWLTLLSDAGIPSGPILDLRGAFAADWAVQRGVLTTVAHPTAGDVMQVQPPWRFDDEVPAVRAPPPRLGEHTLEVLGSLAGLPEGEARLAAGLL